MPSKLEQELENARPVYSIAVAEELSGVTQRMLREYENAGFIKPKRVNSHRRYSRNDIQFIKNVRFYLDKVGVSTTGLKLLYMMAPCWVIKQCGQTECVAYGKTGIKCWEAIREQGESKLRTCEGCPIYLTYEKNKDMALHQEEDIGPKCFLPPEE